MIQRLRPHILVVALLAAVSVSACGSEPQPGTVTASLVTGPTTSSADASATTKPPRTTKPSAVARPTASSEKPPPPPTTETPTTTRTTTPSRFAEPVRYVVTFYKWPGLQKGDEYLGALVDRVNVDQKYAAVLTDDPTFEDRAKKDPNVRRVEYADDKATVNATP